MTRFVNEAEVKLSNAGAGGAAQGGGLGYSGMLGKTITPPSQGSFGGASSMPSPPLGAVGVGASQQPFGGGTGLGAASIGGGNLPPLSSTFAPAPGGTLGG